MTEQVTYKVHENPVWRDKADYLIQALIERKSKESFFEQLWCRKLPGGRFEICCIPFYISGVALGDHVEIDADGCFTRVVAHSGHRTLQVWFLDQPFEVRQDVVDRALALGAAWEFFSTKLISIDVPSEAVQLAVEQVLKGFQKNRILDFQRASD